MVAEEVHTALAVAVAATPADGDAQAQMVGQGEHLLLAEVGATVALWAMEELQVCTVVEEVADIMGEVETLHPLVAEEDRAIAFRA